MCEKPAVFCREFHGQALVQIRTELPQDLLKPRELAGEFPNESGDYPVVPGARELRVDDAADAPNSGLIGCSIGNDAVIDRQFGRDGRDNLVLGAAEGRRQAAFEPAETAGRR